MAQVHPTAILEDNVRLADDVVVGPHCILDGAVGPISIGPGSRLISHVCLCGPLTLGERNTLYPFVTLGYPPQDLKWDPKVAGAGLKVGSGNTFREGVTIHRATSHETPTTIADNNYWMANSHAGHDARVASTCIFANGALLAGFAQVDDRVIMGGNATVHQFCRVGRGAMVSGSVGLSLDLPPFFMLTGINIAGSINVVGLRRSGMPARDIDTVKWVYRTIYRGGVSPKKSLESLRERADHPLVREYIEFIESSKRGICPAKGKAVRGLTQGNPEF
jgi:UDP-N-acetylglucosamine acyltransferase